VFEIPVPTIDVTSTIFEEVVRLGVNAGRAVDVVGETAVVGEIAAEEPFGTEVMLLL
jgi:hypothetical protein